MMTSEEMQIIAEFTSFLLREAREQGIELGRQEASDLIVINQPKSIDVSKTEIIGDAWRNGDNMITEEINDVMVSYTCGAVPQVINGKPVRKCS